MSTDRPSQSSSPNGKPGGSEKGAAGAQAADGKAQAAVADGRVPVNPAMQLPPTRINLPRNGGKGTQDAASAGPQMRLELATADFIGARAQQQDDTEAKALKGQAGALLVLADGLGGHESGAEASRIVRETFVEACDTGAFDAIEAWSDALRGALDLANNRIAGGVNPAHGQRSMASTAVAAVVANGALQWISVGDSHLYIWRQGRMYKLNEDHSQAGLMVRSGQYGPNDPEVLAAKSVLVSALTGRKLEIVDHPKVTFKVEKGDVILLASDGLNTLSEDEIEGIITSLQGDGAQKLSRTLLETVKNRRVDRQDNTTVAIARVLEVPPAGNAAILTDLTEITNHSVTSPKSAGQPASVPLSAPVHYGGGSSSALEGDRFEPTMPYQRAASPSLYGRLRPILVSAASVIFGLILIALIGAVAVTFSGDKGVDSSIGEAFARIQGWFSPKKGPVSETTTVPAAKPPQPEPASAPADKPADKDAATKPPGELTVKPSESRTTAPPPPAAQPIPSETAQPQPPPPTQQAPSPPPTVTPAEPPPPVSAPTPTPTQPVQPPPPVKKQPSPRAQYVPPPAPRHVERSQPPPQAPPPERNPAPPVPRPEPVGPATLIPRDFGG